MRETRGTPYIALARARGEGEEAGKREGKKKRSQAGRRHHRRRRRRRGLFEFLKFEA